MFVGGWRGVVPLPETGMSVHVADAVAVAVAFIATAVAVGAVIAVAVAGVAYNRRVTSASPHPEYVELADKQKANNLPLSKQR